MYMCDFNKLEFVAHAGIAVIALTIMEDVRVEHDESLQPPRLYMGSGIHFQSKNNSSIE
jgi:hypothetical protein